MIPGARTDPARAAFEARPPFFFTVILTEKNPIASNFERRSKKRRAFHSDHAVFREGSISVGVTGAFPSAISFVM